MNQKEKLQIQRIKKDREYFFYLKRSRMSRSFVYNLVKAHSDLIQYFPNADFNIQKVALKSSRNLQYIKNPSEEILEFVLDKGGSKYLYLVENPPESILIKAIEKIQNYDLPEFTERIKDKQNFTDNIKMKLVKECGLCIKYIENPTQEMLLAAVNESPESIRFIKDPDNEVQSRAVKNRASVIEYIKEPSYQLQLIAVDRSADNIRYIKNPDPDILKLALEKNPSTYTSLSEELQTEEMFNIALEGSTRHMIDWVRNNNKKLSLDQKWLALKSDPKCFRVMPEPNKKMKEYAVTHHFDNLKFIENPSIDLQNMAVKADLQAFKHVMKYITNKNIDCYNQEVINELVKVEYPFEYPFTKKFTKKDIYKKAIINKVL